MVIRAGSAVFSRADVVRLYVHSIFAGAPTRSGNASSSADDDCNGGCLFCRPAFHLASCPLTFPAYPRPGIPILPFRQGQFICRFPWLSDHKKQRLNARCLRAAKHHRPAAEQMQFATKRFPEPFAEFICFPFIPVRRPRWQRYINERCFLGCPH